jgi:hypothetical protein
MAKITVEQAKRFLANTWPNKSFWVNNGPVMKNLSEFAAAAKKFTPTQFSHHVNKDKNDFAKWVSEVIGDLALAKKLNPLKTKEALAAAVAARVKELQKIVS